MKFISKVSCSDVPSRPPLEPCALGPNMSGCAVLHIRIDRKLSGTDAKPTIPKTAERRARFSGSSIACRIIRYARYTKNSARDVVSLGSHTQYQPHVAFAQMEPVTSTSNANIEPTSAAERANTSQLCVPFLRYIILATNTTKNAR